MERVVEAVGVGVAENEGKWEGIFGDRSRG